jgi:RHS repeat-associated protein
VDTYRYDPWGNTIGVTGSTYNPVMYAGVYKDHMLGFYQMGARYYSPGTGRFTQVDPLGRSVYEANRYIYTPADPVNYTDPTGLHWDSIIIAAGAAGVGAAIFAAIGCSTVVLCALAGAAGNVTFNLIHNLLDGVPTDEIIRQALIDAGLGAIGGVSTRLTLVLGQKTYSTLVEVIEKIRNILK